MPKYRKQGYYKYAPYARAAVTAARQAYRLYNQFASRPPPPNKRRRTSTSSRSRAVQLRRGVTRPYRAQTKSTGFFKKGRRWTRKRRYRSMARKQNFGVVSTHEVQVTGEAAHLAFVGHATTAPNIQRHLLIRAIVKRYFNSILHQSFSSFLSGTGLQTTDSITMVYRNDYSDGGTNVTVTFTPPAPNPSYASIATYFDNQIPNDQSQLHLQIMYSSVGGAHKEISLIGAVVSWDVKSTLKIQNRSAPTGDEDPESTDITNVPIHGKSYSGTGNGMIKYSDDSGNPIYLLTDFDTGTGCWDGADLTRTLREPPLPGFFKHVKKVSKVHLDPGHLKTSILSWRRKMSVNTFLKISSNVNTDPTRMMYGNYRIFAFEQMMRIDGDGATVKLACENNVRFGCSVFFKKTFTTVEEVGSTGKTF